MGHGSRPSVLKINFTLERDHACQLPQGRMVFRGKDQTMRQSSLDQTEEVPRGAAGGRQNPNRINTHFTD